MSFVWCLQEMGRLMAVSASNPGVYNRSMPKSSTTKDRQDAHTLVDLLPVEKLPAVVHLLQSLTDPVARSLATAPPEDERVDDDELRTVDASNAWLQNHAPIPNREVLAELGLTPEEFDRMARTPLDSHSSSR